MSFNRSSKWFMVIGILLVLLGGFGAVALAQQNQPETANGPKKKVEVFDFDIAEDPTHFVFNADITDENGLPAYGSPFITEGYVDPAGTLDGTNGVIIHEDGTVEPEFPDLVLGKWICRGWLIGEGMLTESGPVAITTQLYQLGETYNSATIITEGYELVDVNVVVSRAITGGTGQYKNAAGEMTQKLLGMTEDMGVNLRVQLTVEQD